MVISHWMVKSLGWGSGGTCWQSSLWNLLEIHSLWCRRKLCIGRCLTETFCYGIIYGGLWGKLLKSLDAMHGRNWRIEMHCGSLMMEDLCVLPELHTRNQDAVHTRFLSVYAAKSVAWASQVSSPESGGRGFLLQNLCSTSYWQSFLPPGKAKLSELGLSDQYLQSKQGKVNFQGRGIPLITKYTLNI